MPRVSRIAAEFHKTRNIDQHVALIAKMVRKSLRDPETRRLAVRIVSNKVTWRVPNGKRNGTQMPMVEAWGDWYLMPDTKQCPPREDECELVQIWNFVRLNCRYVFDITDVDVFMTAAESLSAGGSDCDDATILFAALLKSVGFQVVARVISTTDSPEEWVHVYPLVGFPKQSPTQWIPLDITVTGALPGWEYENIAKTRDYEL